MSSNQLMPYWIDSLRNLENSFFMRGLSVPIHAQVITCKACNFNKKKRYPQEYVALTASSTELAIRPNVLKVFIMYKRRSYIMRSSARFDTVKYPAVVMFA